MVFLYLQYAGFFFLHQFLLVLTGDETEFTLMSLHASISQSVGEDGKSFKYGSRLKYWLRTEQAQCYSYFNEAIRLWGEKHTPMNRAPVQVVLFCINC